MKRIALTLATWLLTMGAAQAQFSAGQGYTELKQTQPTTVGAGVIEVNEFFWYGCPHCSDFEPVAAAWAAKLPANVKLVRVPVAFRQVYESHSRLYYILDALGLVDKLQSAVFNAVHTQGRRLDSQKDVVSFLAQSGVDEKQAESLYNSFSVIAKVKQANAMATAYGIEGVPAMAVNGQYVVNLGTPQVTSQKVMLQVVDFLLDKLKPAASAAPAKPAAKTNAAKKNQQ